MISRRRKRPVNTGETWAKGGWLSGAIVIAAAVALAVVIAAGSYYFTP